MIRLFAQSFLLLKLISPTRSFKQKEIRRFKDRVTTRLLPGLSGKAATGKGRTAEQGFPSFQISAVGMNYLALRYMYSTRVPV
jgi:hypothetical protein